MSNGPAHALNMAAALALLSCVVRADLARAQVPSNAPAVPATNAPYPEPPHISLGPVHVREIEPGLRLPIDLPNALALVGSQNLDILEAKARAAEASAMQEESIGKLVPIAYGSGLFFGQRTSGQTQGYYTDLGRSFDRVNSAGGAELSLNPAEAIFAALAAHRKARAATNDSVEVTQQALASAASGFFLLLEARAEVQIAEQALEASRELQRVVDARESLGAALKADALRASAQVAADKISVSQAGERMRGASVQLALTLKLDPKITLIPIDAMVRQTPLVDSNRGLDDLFRQAFESRPALRAQSERVESAEHNRSAAWAAAVAPAVYTNYQANTVGNIGRHQYFAGSIGLRLSLASFGAARAAGAQLTEEEIRGERLRQQVEAEVIASRDRVQTAAEEVGAAMEGLKAAERALELRQTRFRGGLGIELEVLGSNAALTRARYNVVAAIAGYNIAQIQLLEALGSVCPEALIK